MNYDNNFSWDKISFCDYNKGSLLNFGILAYCHYHKCANPSISSNRNVFDFDSYDKESRESVEEVLHKHGM